MDRPQQFIYSLIMAVYNVAAYLEQSVQSILAQSIGFEEHVQLILVDDGSTDGSGSMCDRYMEAYPNNIVALHQKNAGVSAARNCGLAIAEGIYVGFPDPDDMLSYDTLKNVANFFQLHSDQTDVVSIPIHWFDGKTGEHILNYKYRSGNRIISLEKEPECIQMSASSAFIRRDSLRMNQNLFDERLAVAEDAKLLQKILIDKQTLGVAADCWYYYRRRTGVNQSALQHNHGSRHWYETHVRCFALEIFADCQKELGHVPKFVQFAVLYDLQWRLKELNRGNAPDGFDVSTYKTDLECCLQTIDTDIILAQKHIPKTLQLYLLRLKSGCVPEMRLSGQNLCLCFPDGTTVCEKPETVTFDFISLDSVGLKLEGRVIFPVCNDMPEIWVHWNQHTFKAKPIAPSSKLYQPQSLLGDALETVVGFRVELPVEGPAQSYQGTIWYGLNGNFQKLGFGRFGEFCPIGPELKNICYMEDIWTMFTSDSTLFLKKEPAFRQMARKFRYLIELWTKGSEGRYAVFLRLTAAILRKLIRTPVWLISDRINCADDNGEAFFQFLREQKVPIHLRFLLSEASADWSRLKETGVVIRYFSFRHKLCHLLCEYILSSHADHYTTNPFGKHWVYYRDLQCRPKFIFLQHGIIKDDLSDWLNRYSKNIYGFVVSTQREWDSVVHGRYDYSEHNVWMTGLCRYDLLYHNEKRIITIMPTWRKYLMGCFSKKTGTRTLDASFEESEYFKFYSALLTDTRLLCAAKQHRWRLYFHPHPLLTPYTDRFARSAEVGIFPPGKLYRDIFAESELIVTDYSSVAFDFAYLRKPVLYCRPDHDKFISGIHTYTPGYFSYAEDGFGEITYGIDETVDHIIAYMQDHCRLKATYKARISKFFAYQDSNNRLRLLQKMMDLERKGND